MVPPRPVTSWEPVLNAGIRFSSLICTLLLPLLLTHTRAGAAAALLLPATYRAAAYLAVVSLTSAALPPCARGVWVATWDLNVWDEAACPPLAREAHTRVACVVAPLVCVGRLLLLPPLITALLLRGAYASARQGAWTSSVLEVGALCVLALLSWVVAGPAAAGVPGFVIFCAVLLSMRGYLLLWVAYDLDCRLEESRASPGGTPVQWGQILDGVRRKRKVVDDCPICLLPLNVVGSVPRTWLAWFTGLLGAAAEQQRPPPPSPRRTGRRRRGRPPPLDTSSGPAVQVGPCELSVLSCGHVMHADCASKVGVGAPEVGHDLRSWGTRWCVADLTPPFPTPCSSLPRPATKRPTVGGWRRCWGGARCAGVWCGGWWSAPRHS